MRTLRRIAPIALLTTLVLTAGCSSSGSGDSSGADGQAVTPVSTSNTHAFGQADGSCPSDKPVKAYENRAGKQFLQPDESGYADVRAAFCFVDVAAARAAGFAKTQ